MTTPINAVSATDIELFAKRPFFHEYQRLATRSAIYPGKGTPLGLAYVALKLNGEAGELAEHVGKAMRDDDLVVPFKEAATEDQPAQHYFGYTALTPERREAIIKEAGDVLWYLSAITNELGLRLQDIADANLVKLADRTRRNALQGSGDTR